MADTSKNRLFDSDDDDDGGGENEDVVLKKKKKSDTNSTDTDEFASLNINNNYASKYNDWRRKEELQKLKDKYGDNLDVMSEIDDGSSDDSGDEENGEHDDDQSESDESTESSPNDEDDMFDDQFLKVFSALKKKDPSIYDKSFHVDKLIPKQDVGGSEKVSETKNSDSDQHQSTSSGKREKKMTLQDYHRKLIEEKKGITEEEEQDLQQQQEEEEEKPVGYYEELYNIRKEIQDLVKNDDDEDNDDDNEDDQLFSIKDQHQQHLESNKSTSQDKSKILEQIWADDSIAKSKEEKFLKDYIVNKRYQVDDDDHNLKVKKFAKEPGSHFGGFEHHDESDENESDEDEDEDDEDEANNEANQIKVANYHFEEPDATIIRRYPRTLTSVRDIAKVNAKKTHRAEVRERKREEKKQELKRLRKLKREEIEAKIEKLKSISGNTALDIKDIDLNVIIDDENDFDQEKYDQKMQLLFGDSYYANAGGDERSKPKFDYIPEIDDHLYDDDDNDVDVDGCLNQNQEKKKKKNKKQIKAQRDIMADDDIGLYEDIIGGEVVTRFRYRMVEPNDFGLTDEEILFADDKELNKWCSLKKCTRYRTKEEESYDKRVFGQKGKNVEFKKKIFKSLHDKQQSTTMGEDGGELNDEEEDEQNDDNDSDEVNGGGGEAMMKKNKKKRSKKRRKKNPTTIQSTTNNDQSSVITNKDNQAVSTTTPTTSGNDLINKNQQQSRASATKASRKRKRPQKGGGGGNQSAPSLDIDVQRLKAYGISTREIKKMKYRR